MADLEIEALLQKTVGLKVTAVGETTVGHSVQRRMKALGITDKRVYVAKLKSSALELKELIEEVVIPETWFFRDSVPFKAFIQFLESKWIPKHNSGHLNVLSVPCSTGEEPYSLAMTLLHYGWPPEKFSIHAVDISSRSIARAKEAVYSEHSFRDEDIHYRDHYFQKKQKAFILHKTVREKVQFHVGNLLNNAFMNRLGIFDVIFFRNVLIYFDTLSRHQSIITLENILTDDGMLFVGHAEASLFSNSPFNPALYSRAFAFQKKPKQTFITAAGEPPPITTNQPIATRLFPNRPEPVTASADLKYARELADRGDISKAAAICEEHLKRSGSSAEALFLMAVIRDAAGDTEQAERLFHKTLYLKPDHEDALLFLLLQAEKKGDLLEARTLKQRIESIHKKNPPTS